MISIHFSKCVPAHILHQYSDEMAKKSEDAVIEALLKDETQYSDMIDIMKFMQDCLGKDFPEDGRVLSMGDLVNDKLVLRGTLWMATHHEKDFNCWSHSVQIGTFNCAYCV